MTLIELAPLLTLRDAFLGVASALCLLIVFILGWACGAACWRRRFWNECERRERDNKLYDSIVANCIRFVEQRGNRLGRPGSLRDETGKFIRP